MSITMLHNRTLRLERITIGLRKGGTLIRDFSIAVPPGHVATVMGPSGSGKSTLLAYVGGFLDRSAFDATGQVVIDGQQLADKPAESRRLGVLFQDPVLFPHLSVGGNLLFGLPRDRHTARGERMAIAERALAEAGLEGYADRDPSTLSGGQKARVALLRTLLADPRALLLDEPFGKLDAPLRAEFRKLVFHYGRERNLPTLLVTHEPADAAAAGGPVINLVNVSDAQVRSDVRRITRPIQLN